MHVATCCNHRSGNEWRFVNGFATETQINKSDHERKNYTSYRDTREA
jgi:hypothetical protein